MTIDTISPGSYHSMIFTVSIPAHQLIGELARERVTIETKRHSLIDKIIESINEADIYGPGRDGFGVFTGQNMYEFYRTSPSTMKQTHHFEYMNQGIKAVGHKNFPKVSTEGFVKGNGKAGDLSLHLYQDKLNVQFEAVSMDRNKVEEIRKNIIDNLDQVFEGYQNFIGGIKYNYPTRMKKRTGLFKSGNVTFFSTDV